MAAAWVPRPPGVIGSTVASRMAGMAAVTISTGTATPKEWLPSQKMPTKPAK